ERDERLAQAVDAGSRGGMAVDVLPGGFEARERPVVDRLDLLAQHRERGAAQTAKHLRVAPLALGPAGPQLTAHERAGTLELAEHRRAVDPIARAQVIDRERPVRRRVP